MKLGERAQGIIPLNGADLNQGADTQIIFHFIYIARRGVALAEVYALVPF